MTPLRLVFMGTPELARVILEASLGDPTLEVVAVVTQPDRPKGRDLKLTPSPVKELAVRSGLPILQPERARDEQFIEQLRVIGPELIIVAAFGQLLPPILLEVPRHGCVNVHTSLLPKYRGAAPIQWAIMNGESETGITLMKMDAGLDTGPLLTQEAIPIGPDDTAATVHERLARLGASLLLRSIPAYIAGKLPPRPQPELGISHAPKIKKQEGLIDWKQSAKRIHDRVRAMVPWPGAFTLLRKPGGAEAPGSQTPGKLLKVWQTEVVARIGEPGSLIEAVKDSLVVGCGDNALRLLIVQTEGGRRLSAEQFLAGHPLRAGERLG